MLSQHAEILETFYLSRDVRLNLVASKKVHELGPYAVALSNDQVVGLFFEKNQRDYFGNDAWVPLDPGDDGDFDELLLRALVLDSLAKAKNKAIVERIRDQLELT